MKRIAISILTFLILSASCALAQDQDVKPEQGAEGTYTTTAQAKSPEEIARIQAAQKEAEEAKKQAQQLEAEAQRAKLEAELLEKESALQKEKLAAEKQETEATKVEVEALKNGSKDPEAVQKALEKARQEQKEDLLAEEQARVTEEKMRAAQLKASVAEKELKLAQEKMSLLMSEVRGQKLGRSFLETIMRSATIVLIGLILFLLIRISFRRLAKVLTKEGIIVESEGRQRARTAMNLISWLATIVIVLTVIYMVLENHGFNMAPLLAGAGIVGLAFGFGGQYLIRDLINGLFILIEGQYSINDVVKIGDYGGLVEDINLRITKLRDLEGRVIFIPNGEIKTVVNYTMDYAQALLDIGVAYKENVDQVMEVIKAVGAEMREDDYFGHLILDELEMLGVDNFSDSAVIIKFRMKTLPIKQWEVMREFRRRLKNRFDKLGIEIPFPHRTLYWGSDKENQWLKESLGKMAERKGERE